MKRCGCLLIGLSLWLTIPGPVRGHEPVVRARTPIRIPDIPGYRTLKCDFHIHTVFSDGLVWPSVRAEEAWREGLDAIAITDHIEYLPHKNDVSTNHNRAFEVARPHGASLNLIVIRGSEITREMPPGHLNAIFLTNSASLEVKEWRDAVAEAHRQGAFIFWNHPGWDAQLQSDNLVRWYPEHTELLEKGMLHGIEVVNGREYYPDAFRWALDKPLVLMSTSDIHNPLNLDYHVHDGDHRPLTLVFARERSAESIREALFARRTAVYSADRLMGDEQFLRPIFERSVSVENGQVRLPGQDGVQVQIHNASDVTFILERKEEHELVTFPRSLRLPAHKTVLAGLTSTSETRRGHKKVTLAYRVTNLLTAPDHPLEAGIPVELEFVPR